MRISIIEVLDTERKIVEFSGPVGTAWGYWNGQHEPQVGAFDVEFDIPDVVTHWSVKNGPDLIEGDHSKHQVVLRGSIESVGDDSVVALRVDQDIVLIEIGSDITKASIGDSIEFTTPKILLYPYSI